MPCRALNAAGRPCRAAEHLLDHDDLCPAHRDGGAERMSELGRKGGKASAKRFGDDGHGVGDLPELRTPEDAERWAEVVGRAAAEQRLTLRTARFHPG